MKFQYLCSNCGAQTTKKPCGTVLGKTGKQGLHGFRCPNCGPGVKIKRTNAGK